MAGEIYLVGTASDNGGVYQAVGDQTVTHLNLNVGMAAGLGGSSEVSFRVTPEGAQRHTQLVIEALTLAVEHFRQKCTELALEARRARAEGRREALREVQEKLRDAESRVMRAQEKKREAERERERLEALMARTRYEAEAARRQATQPWERPDDERAFEDILASADHELSLIRSELSTLASDLRRDEESSGGDRVVSGEVVSQPTQDKGSSRAGAEPAMAGSTAAESLPSPGPPAARSRSSRTTPTVRPGRVRCSLGRMFFVGAGIPMPMAGAAIRLVYSRTPGVAVVWSILFPVAAVVLAVGVTSLLILFARLAYAWQKDDGTVVVSCFFHAVLGAALFVVGISLSPEAVPPLTECGRLLAEYFGPL
nr:hypothetical protein [Streptomyces chartreusis]